MGRVGQWRLSEYGLKAIKQLNKRERWASVASFCEAKRIKRSTYYDLIGRTKRFERNTIEGLLTAIGIPGPKNDEYYEYIDAEKPSHNLPHQLTSFIGREKEIADVPSLLTKTRLLTLTGAGGCGKTRLSLRVAAEALEQYSDGVWLVELAPHADPALVAQKVAQVLGIKEQAGQPLEQSLLDNLKSKHLLLLLDNCEHLIATCAQLMSALLRSCPQVKGLATSREPLGIAGEQTYRVPSLQVPDPRQTLSCETLPRYEAVRLFIERAQLVCSGFAVTNANASALAQVCRRLDGIPLAIELAAARVRSLSVEEINARLDDRFQLLKGGDRAALPRHQTLRALMDWSYDLLREPEKLLLARLAVFVGGWTMEAVKAVCSGGGIEAWEVLDLLMALVDKSLVVYEEQGERDRYRFLETIREYSRERMQESGEEAAIRTRHRSYFLALAEKAGPHLMGPEQGTWLERLEAEHDNLRAAIEWCKVREDGIETGMRLTAALWRFWMARGHLSEGRKRLEEALAQEGAQKWTKERAKATNGAGVLASIQGEYAVASGLHEESLAISRDIGDRLGIASSLSNLGEVAHLQREYTSAQAYHEDGLSIRREIGDRWGIASSLNNLGNLAGEQGDFAQARTYYDESLSIWREIGDRRGIANSLGNLGRIAQEQRDYVQAREFLVGSLQIVKELQDRWLACYELTGLADLARAQSQWERAAHLWGAVERLREVISAPRTLNEREEYDRMVAEVRSAMGEAAFTATWTKGRAITLEQAIEYALQNDRIPE